MHRTAKGSRTTPSQPALQTRIERTAVCTRTANKLRLWGPGLLCLNLAVIPLGCQSETERSATASGSAPYHEADLAVGTPGPFSRQAGSLPSPEDQRNPAPPSRSPALDLAPKFVALNTDGANAESSDADSSDAATYEPDLDILPSANRRSARAASSARVRPPQVVLSAEHQATCRVHVGSTFPNLELTLQDGNTTTLSQLISDGPAVVFFWNEKQAMSLKQIHEMRNLGAKRELRRDAISTLPLIAIHVGPQTKRNDIDQHTSSDKTESSASSAIVFCNDQQSEAFGQVASPEASTPRSFVLDGKRQVVWLDIEYSRATRRQLQAAIDYVVKQR